MLHTPSPLLPSLSDIKRHHTIQRDQPCPCPLFQCRRFCLAEKCTKQYKEINFALALLSASSAAFCSCQGSAHEHANESAPTMPHPLSHVFPLLLKAICTRQSNTRKPAPTSQESIMTSRNTTVIPPRCDAMFVIAEHTSQCPITSSHSDQPRSIQTCLRTHTSTN